MIPDLSPTVVIRRDVAKQNPCNPRNTREHTQTWPTLKGGIEPLPESRGGGCLLTSTARSVRLVYRVYPSKKTLWRRIPRAHSRGPKGASARLGLKLGGVKSCRLVTSTVRSIHRGGGQPYTAGLYVIARRRPRVARGKVGTAALVVATSAPLWERVGRLAY